VKNRFDPDKDAKNIERHHISLARAFDMTVIRFSEDQRFDYGEVALPRVGHHRR
jgi:uncharacterized DUF497 family protein